MDDQSLKSQITVTPWLHQTDAFNFLKDREYGALFSAMGTGKSLVAIGLIGHWKKERNLIVCPSSMVPVWEREIRNMAGYEVEPIPLTGPLKDRIATLEGAMDYNLPQRIYIINYEALVYRQMADALDRARFSVVILDESQRIKTPSSQTSKAAMRISRWALQKLIMTGTPAADKPTDIYQQMRFLDPSIFGTNYAGFFERYVVYRLASTSSGGRYKEILGYQNLDEMGNIIDEQSFRVPAEVLDLIPALPPMRIPVQLGNKAKTAYKKMLKESLVELDKGEVAATNILTKMLRLQEITSGYLRTDPDLGGGERTTTIIDDSKIKAVEDLLDQFDPLEPVVVFYQFATDGQRIVEAVKKSGRQAFRLNGQKNELDTWKAYKAHGPVLVCQLQSGSTGISMVEASKVIYYSHSFSLATFEQSLARVDRPGQTRQVHYYHLMVPGTIDEALLQALENKKVTADGLLAAVREKTPNSHT